MKKMYIKIKGFVLYNLDSAKRLHLGALGALRPQVQLLVGYNGFDNLTLYRTGK